MEISRDVNGGLNTFKATMTAGSSLARRPAESVKTPNVLVPGVKASQAVIVLTSDGHWLVAAAILEQYTSLTFLRDRDTTR